MSTDNDILVVDDHIPSLRLLTELLEKKGYNVRPVEKAQAALDSAAARPPGLILLDVLMPDMNGYEICRRLKQDTRTAHVPILFVSALNDAEAKDRGFQAGGVDYISKPFEESEVLARVKTHMNLHQLQQNLAKIVEKRTAEAMESESRFTNLVENANEAIVITQDEAVKYCNPKISELTGYSPEEMYSLAFDAFIHPEDLEMVLNEYRSRLSGEQPKNSYLMRMINRDGRERYAFVNSALINWDDKPAALAMVTDITERKQAEEKLEKSKQRFRNLMEQSPLDIVLLTPEGQIREVNEAWLRNWDVQADEADKIMAAYNMRTDSQFADLGLAPLVERAFTGENVVLPPLRYIPSSLFDDIGLEGIEARERWIQTHIYSIKDTSGSIESVVTINMDITDQKRAEAELRNTYEEIKELKDQLEAESDYLREEIKLEHNFETIIGNSDALKYSLNRVEQVAPTDSPVLIMGETGVGKELIARALHQLSPQHKRVLIKVNCAALPAELIESELFGREKGAYTGANTTQPGRFELAKGSTLFLDEIGELPLELQAKLLRVLDSGEFERLGSSRTMVSDARIIAATNRVLEEEVQKGRFREDLWYRLKVYPITVPSLRERVEDIPLLVTWFVDQLSKKMGKTVGEIPKRTMQMLQQYHWPGNIRELKHAIEGACINTQGRRLQFDLLENKDQKNSDFQSFAEMERDYILRVLEAKKWRIGGANSAASTLDMHVNTLRGRMKKLGIKKN